MTTPPPPHWPPPPDRQAYGEPPLNGFALASLLVGLVCMPPLGIVFGIVALVQIARKGERGRPLAIAGLAVSLVTSLLLVLAVDRAAGSLFDRLDALSPYESVAGELTDIEDMRAGDCFNVPGGDLLDEDPLLYRIACTEVHEGEVTASTRLDRAGALPGGEELKKAATDACWRAQDAYAMDTWALPGYAEMFWFAPARDSWGGGARRLLCVIGTAEREHRGSLRRDAGMLKPEQVAFLRAMNEVDLALGQWPEEELDEALPAYREWARAVDRALDAEVRVLQEAADRPELAGPARAQLDEVEAARRDWQKAGEAVRPADFQDAWDRAAAALRVDTEKALRGAYGLATTVPEWLADQPRGAGPAAEA
ncbi:DUF4190 domain-containing protein [Streptomyces sp. NPDC032472]|uniref:DUF4190 domain-containing protein n=1 Tax=Streptomyces sp. NPDC032472 TaxID=3155018 RepID=UPI0033FF7714